MMAERAERVNKRRRASEESSRTGTESSIGVGSDVGVRRVVGGEPSVSGTGSGVGVGSGGGGESSVTGGPKLTNCCRCNRTGSCRLCRCAKAGRLCDKCLPGNHGRCQNRPARGALPSRPNQSPAVTATASCVVCGFSYSCQFK